MTYSRWTTIEHHDELGVIVHGPAIVARSTGIAFAVRCIFAHSDGLILDFVLRASGVQAEAACRQTFRARPDRPSIEGSEPAVFLEGGGHRVDVCSYGESSAEGGGETFRAERNLGVSILPPDGTITLTASWPEAGLAEGSVTLTLEIPDDLDSRVLRLL
jgi:hypothetical protein